MILECTQFLYFYLITESYLEGPIYEVLFSSLEVLSMKETFKSHLPDTINL